MLSVQSSIAVAFLLFILLTSNPFLRVNPPPADGSGLNPILQDPALAFHPPFLYTGYVGFSIAFSFAIAALIEGRIDAAWARWVRPWTLAAWMCLTIGIAMGSWWAYYELGWGGWWFWDPVENASFMPWLAGTALLHSALVMEKRDALKVWTVLLAILTFSLSLMGTFLVRSGVLTSVHAFAVDPQRGVFILAIMSLFTGGGLALFALRARNLRQGGIFAPISREGALVLNNILLTTACATVLVGTLYPLLLESLTGDKISVGPPYFDWTFGPLMVPLLLALPFGPFLAWKRGDVLGAAQRLVFAAMLAVVVMVLGMVAFHRGPWLAPFGIALGVFVMAGAVSDLAWRVRLGSVPLIEAWRRFTGLPRSAIGSAMAHFGVGMMVVGVVATSAYREERIVVMKPGEQLALSGYDLTFKGVAPATGPNYREEVAVFDVTRGGAPVAHLEPSRRIYDMPPEPTTEAGIHVAWRGDLYVRARRQAERRRLRGACLLQPAGALHLARRGGDVPGRGRVAVGSPPARRRAGPRPPPRRGPRGMRRRASALALIAAALALAAAGAGGGAGRDTARPGARSAGAPALLGACAASSARTSRSTTATRRWRAICVSSCASGSRPATAMRR